MMRLLNKKKNSGRFLRLLGIVLILIITGYQFLAKLQAGKNTSAHKPSLPGTNEPARESTECIVLEPSSWIGEKLPINDYVDIGNQLKEGNWLVLFYHSDCQNCIEAIAKLEKMAKELAGNESFLCIALIEVPPYGEFTINKPDLLYMARLPPDKQWLITTPALVLTKQAEVVGYWPQINMDISEFIKFLY